MTIGAIVVLTNTRDLAADDVVRRLDSAGHRVIRLNADILDQSPAPSWTVQDDLSAQDVGAVWWRQFEEPGLEVTDASDIDTLLVTRAQWRAWLSTLHTPETPWINDIWPARRAENKIEQLRAANRLGFMVPRTLVTNDPSEARAFSRQQPAIVKALSSGYFEFSGHAFVYTHELTEEILTEEANWLAQPVIVQQRVPGVDIRVVVVGDSYFGAQCSTEVLDWRTAGGSAQWKSYEVSPTLRQLCCAYLREFGLRYCAFDFMEHDGDCWFLEANQAGEWAFLERTLELGITDAMVSCLVNLASGASQRRVHSHA